jgi:hypothetical protein
MTVPEKNLRPCPFCGGRAQYDRVGTKTRSCVVSCEDCGCRLETGEVWTSGQAWNKRHGEGVEPVTTGLRETTEDTMIAAHKAGVAYWKRNKPLQSNLRELRSVARSCGWHGEDCEAWVAGFLGAKRRESDARASEIKL